MTIPERIDKIVHVIEDDLTETEQVFRHAVSEEAKTSVISEITSIVQAAEKGLSIAYEVLIKEAYDRGFREGKND